MARLAGFLAFVALATSRIGLVAHELVAHGGAALACGAEIIDVEMFWFAGGWIRYRLPEPSLAATLVIAMAGIALELVVGLALWSGVRGEHLGRRVLRGIGAALVVHATWYLATGAFHGFGDGLVLHRELGAARVPVAIAAGLATCVAACFGAREVLGALARTLPGSPRVRWTFTLVAVVFAAGVHAALAAGELAIRRDETYAQTMKPERERVIAKELHDWTRAQAARGVPIDESARRQQVLKLRREHRDFPFVWLLGAATAIAVIAGARAAKPVAHASIDDRLLFKAAVIAIAAIWSVVVIDGLIPM